METEIKRICNELAAFVKERGSSKSFIAKKAAVCRTVVSNTLNGVKSPSFEVLLKISKAVGYSIEIRLALKHDSIAVIHTADNIEFNETEFNPF